MMFLPINAEQKLFSAELANTLAAKFKGINGKFEGLDKRQSHYLGFLTQTVLADYFRQERPNSKGADNFDLLLEGKLFDVKYSSFNGSQKFLRIHEKELKKPMDAYILTGIKEERVIVYGYAWKTEVLAGAEKNFGYGLNKVIPVEALHPLEVWIPNPI